MPQINRLEKGGYLAEIGPFPCTRLQSITLFVAEPFAACVVGN